MTVEEISLIKLSFIRVLEIKEKAGRLFYHRLFQIAPDTRAMFTTDVDQQARKLIDSLAVAISSLRDGPALGMILEGLGQRHVAYGVRDEHYDKVGEALLWTLEQALGDAFTPQTRQAWAKLYGVVAGKMKAAAAGRAAIA